MRSFNHELVYLTWKIIFAFCNMNARFLSHVHFLFSWLYIGRDMVFARPITYVASWLGSFTSKHAMYIYNLEVNLKSLINQTVELKNLSLEVTRRVECAERQRMTPTVQVNGWLHKGYMTCTRKGKLSCKKAILNYRRSVFSVAFLGIATPATGLERK